VIFSRLAALIIATAASAWLGGCSGSRHDITPTPVDAGPVPEGKLPEGVRPTRYRLSLEVIPSRDTFTGTAMITVELDGPTRVIWMHGQHLDVRSVYATHATTRIEGTWEEQTSDGVAKVELREALPAGRSTLHFEYVASFDTPLRGLYRVTAGGAMYAFTQFESISARLAFPCFDEPRFKTPFDLTLTVLAEHFAAANTPVDRAIALPDGLQRISFLPTPALPTYLVALAVGPFDVVTGAAIPPNEHRPFPIPLRGIAARGRGPLLQYALGHAAEHIEALERYFGMPYPYRKLDLVAVPDFAAGAMENVGLITFREWLLLLDDERATEGQRRAFAYVMAHELAHQWFGNLVTMPWWDDIWLNEAFATWMGNKVVHELHPEYRSNLAAVAYAQRAMELDSLTSARSIRQPVGSNHDIKNAFDMITYQKGGAVLSMFEHWMGEETFREGIRLYLSRHQGGTATSDDLLAALDEASQEDVTSPFLTFLTQPGVPLLRSVGDAPCDSGVKRLSLVQERYLPLGSTGSPHATWEIPLCIRHANGTTCEHLRGSEARIELPGCPEWWMPNDRGAGYFRFSMSSRDWAALRRKGFATLSDTGKQAVADSLYADFARGSLEAEDLLAWFPRFVATPLRQVSSSPISTLQLMMADASSPDTRPNIVAYTKQLYAGLYRRLGWRAKPEDSSDTKLLRATVLELMVMDVRDRKARVRAAKLGRTYLGYGTEPMPDAVDPQLVELALATAVQEGDGALFDELLARLAASNDSTLRGRILAALGHAEDPALAERALELSLDSRLRRNEAPQVLAVQLRNRRTRDRAWAWLKEHFDAFAERVGNTQAGSAPWYAAALCTAEAADDVQAFFEPRVSALAGGPRNLAGAVEAIRLCAARADAQRPGVDRAFKRP